ncbi:reverse transcriptase domain-containing protein [Tanacetum coccineum]
MHTRASNSELVEPLPEPESTLNRRLHRRNRRVPFEQRNNPPQHPRIVYPLNLNINYFHHFLAILRNYDPMDDEPIDTKNEVVPLMMFPLSLTEEAKTWLHELNEETIETWDELRTTFISQFFPPALFDRLLKEIRAFSQHENESLTDAWLRMTEMLRNCHGHNLDDEDVEPTPQPKPKTPTPVKETPNQPDLGASINLMLYSLYVKLSLETLKPTKMSVRLADRSFQYPVGTAKNMLVEVGKFTFPADFVILEMEEDSKVPLILGRPFLYTVNAVIRVKQKQLNL